MKAINQLFTKIILTICLCGSLQAENLSSETNQGISDLDSLVLSNNDLGVEVYRQIDQGGNVVFSPYCLSTALQMLYAGSAGITHAQMARILHFVLPEEKLQTSASELAGELGTGGRRSSDDFILSIGNSLWVQGGHPLLPDFEKIVSQKYKGIAKTVDFKRKPDSTRAEINQWIKTQTRGKIMDLLGPREITELTRVVLVSTLYLNGKWQNQFDPNLTRPTPFFPSESQTITLPMMSITGNFQYLKDREFAILELPYHTRAESPKVAMYIVLPNSTFGLRNVERSLSAQRLLGLIHQMKPTKVTVSLPKFKMTSSFDLKNALEKLGLADPFTSKADFSGIDGTQDLQVSNVIQKAFISVDEKGTEAGIATAIPIGLTAIREAAPEVFLADHPFQFFVIDKLTGTFILMGRVTQP